MENRMTPNKRARVDAGFAVLFAFRRPWPGTTQHERYAARHPPAKQRLQFPGTGAESRSVVYI